MNVLFLLLLLGINPPTGDTQTVYIKDSYVEINHFWGTYGVFVDNKSCELGYTVFDQVLFWKWNPQEDRYDLIHWDLIKNCRLRERLVDTEAEPVKTNHLAWLKQHRINILKETAKKQKESIEDIVIYYDDPFLGSSTRYNKPEHNPTFGRWETLIEVNGKNYLFLTDDIRETNTTFDPDIEYRQIYNRPSGSTKFRGIK